MLLNVMNVLDYLFYLVVACECPFFLFPLWPDVSHHTDFCCPVPRLQRVSGPGSGRNAAGWKAVSRATVTQVCQSV